MDAQQRGEYEENGEMDLIAYKQVMKMQAALAERERLSN